MARCAAAMFALLAGGCAQLESSGSALDAIPFPAIASAYLPLEGWNNVIVEHQAAAIVVAPGIAATNAHNANLVDPASVIGISADYDLMFFRAPGLVPPPIATATAGESVLAYGQGMDNDLRAAKGVVRGADVAMPPICPTCARTHAIAFEADAGRGFSGGPVVDAQTGALLGVVFGFRRTDEDKDLRMMYAYDMEHVLGELAKLPIAATR